MSHDYSGYKPPMNASYGQNQQRSYGNNQGGYQQKQFTPQSNQERENKPLPDPMFYLPYGVVGSRDTPAPIVERMKELAKHLAEYGYTVRTGALDGMDKAIVELLPKEKVELQLPWKNFGNMESKTSYSSPEVMAIAKHFATGWDGLKLPVQGFLGKNVRVVLGEKARSLAMFLVVHSEDGAETAQEVTARTGAAGHAIKIACHHNVPVFNMQKPDAEDRIYRMFHLLKTNNKPMIEDEMAL